MNDEAFKRSDTVSVADAELLDEIAGSEKDLYFTAQKLRRARRLEAFGLLQNGNLGDRYFGLTHKGQSFVDNRRATRT